MNGKLARKIRKAAAEMGQPNDTAYTFEPSTRRTRLNSGGEPVFHTATILLAKCERRSNKRFKSIIKRGKQAERLRRQAEGS